jgi:hypothetical protein
MSRGTILHNEDPLVNRRQISGGQQRWLNRDSIAENEASTCKHSSETDQFATWMPLAGSDFNRPPVILFPEKPPIYGPPRAEAVGRAPKRNSPNGGFVNHLPIKSNMGQTAGKDHDRKSKPEKQEGFTTRPKRSATRAEGPHRRLGQVERPF